MPYVEFKAVIQKFKKKGEKTGWTYIDIPSHIANEIKKGEKKSFRVKGTLDETKIEKAAIIPMGGGDFILPLNAALRKAIGKREGAMLKVKICEDKATIQLDKELVTCLKDDKEASEKFYSMPKSHQNYYSKWIASAKTDETKAKRIAATIRGIVAGMTFAEILRYGREK